MIKDTNFSDKLNSFMDMYSKAMTPEMLLWVKQQCEEQMLTWFNGKIKDIKINLVIDSNIVIQSIIRYAKNNKESVLFKLGDNPVFSLYAPSKLKEEVEDYIEHKRKKSINKTKLLEGWSLLQAHIITKNIQNDNFERHASEIIGLKDKDDVPFVGVYLEMGAIGILTDDAHYNHPDIKKFALSDLGSIVGTYHRGMFSFFMMNDVLPPILELTKEVLVVMAQVIFDFLKTLFLITKSILSGSFTELGKLLSKIPSWLAILLIGVSAAVLLHGKTRDKITKKVQNAWNEIKPIITDLIESIKEIISMLFDKIIALSPYLDMTSITLQQISKDIEDFKNEIKSLNLEDAGHFS